MHVRIILLFFAVLWVHPVLASSFHPFIPYQDRTAPNAIDAVRASPHWHMFVGELANVSGLHDDEIVRRLAEHEYTARVCDDCMLSVAGIGENKKVKWFVRRSRVGEQFVCIEQACFSTWCANPVLLPNIALTPPQQPVFRCEQTGASNTGQGFMYVPGYFRRGHGYDGTGIGWTHTTFPTNCVLQ